MRILLATLAILCVCRLFGNEHLLVVGGNEYRTVPWSSPGSVSSGKPFALKSTSAIGGDVGILYECRLDHPLQMDARGPFFNNECWLRFSLRIDKWDYNLKSGDTLHVKDFMNISLGEPIKNEQPSVFSRSMIFSIRDSLYLCTRLRFSADPSGYQDITFPLRKNIDHHIEYCWQTEPTDTLSFLLYVDDVQAVKIRRKFPFQRDYVSVNLFSYKRRKEKPMVFSLDEFALSDRRLAAPLSAPLNTREIITENGVVFLCDSAGKASMSGHKATCWVLQSKTDSLLPVYYTEELDPLYLYERTLPFELDKDSYAWYAYYVNINNIASPRSLIREFNIEESQTSKTVRLKDVLIKGKPEAGNWHDFTILTENPLPEKASGFFIVSLTHPSYKYSHRGNKGGAYVSSMNTVFNISISLGNEIALFEKTDENSLKSRRLSSSTVGQTMDFRKGKFRLERAKGKIRFRAKIPEKAIPGEWILSAYGEWEDGRTTNIVRKKISVQASSGQNASYSIPILFLFIVTISGSVVVLLKTKKNKMSIDPEVNLQDQVFLLVCEYIRTNINKNVTLKDISMAHSLTFKATQEAIKRNGYKTLPALVNEIRMKKAEELLSLPNLSIAEISYSLGYDDPDYFSRVFRSFSGMKPTDYRKKITES